MNTPEKDAELEKFIEGRLNYFFGESTSPIDFYRFEILNELIEVSRRARERAIEECIEAIRKPIADSSVDFNDELGLEEATRLLRKLQPL